MPTYIVLGNYTQKGIEEIKETDEKLKDAYELAKEQQGEIKQLFYNTTARRNFLRADSTELHQIISTIKRFFLAYPDIEFEV